MKILAAVNNMWPPPVHITGVSIIYECQKRFAKKGHEIHILTSIGLWDKNSQKYVDKNLEKTKKWFKDQEKLYGIKFHTYNMSWLQNYPKLAFILNRLIVFPAIIFLNLKYNFDVIHEYTITPILIYRSFLLKLITRKKHIHSLIAEMRSLTGSYQWLVPLKPKIHKIICTNQSIYKSMVNIGYNRIDIEELTLGVDTTKFESNKFKYEELAQKYEVDPDEKVVLFLAPIEPHKGPNIFIKGAIYALQEIKNSGNNTKLKFLIATYKSPGKKPYSERKQEIVNLMGEHKNSFKIIEGIHNVPELMNLSTIVCFPQTTLDGATGHPITLLETMAAKRIVVASNIEGLNEVIQNNENGFLFENKNPKSLGSVFLKATATPNINQIAQKAYDDIQETYNINIVADKMVKIYESKK